MNTIRSLVLLALVALLAACATQQHQRDLLKTTLYDYQGAVRWNNFAAAAGFLDPEVVDSKPMSALQMQRYEQIQITGYHVKGSQSDLDGGSHEQAVEISFVNRHTQTERSVLDRQVWRYDPKVKRWWLVTGLPDITSR